MIGYEAALELVRAAASPTAVERVRLEAAVGRVLREPVVSPLDLPPFDNSAMDGFAVRAADIAGASAGNPIELEVRGSLAAGDLPGAPARPGIGMEGVARELAGTATEIMTGAALPQGYDTVIKVEDVEKLGASDGGVPRAIRLRAPATAGTNIRRAGEDIRSGELALAAGHRIAPAHLLALASFGITQVAVSRPMRAGILSTGRELVPFYASHVPEGKIRNATAPFLKAELLRLGADVTGIWCVGDEPQPFLDQLEIFQRDGVDVVLTTGAVSMGRHDFIVPALRRMGAEILFHKVAIRPGKPILLARLPSGTVLFGLPGNPISTAVGFRFFVEPFLRACQGLEPDRGALLPLGRAVKRPSGLRCFYEGALRLADGRVTAEVLPGLASFRVRPLLEAAVWVEIAEGEGVVEPGTLVRCHAVEGRAPWSR